MAKKKFDEFRKNKKPKPGVITAKGRVEESFANAMFRVKLTDGRSITAHICGKIRKRNTTVLVGNNVTVEMSIYDMTKGRICSQESPHSNTDSSSI